MKKNKKQPKQPKARNVVAVAAITRSGAGRHTDRKKQAARRACRGKVQE